MTSKVARTDCNKHANSGSWPHVQGELTEADIIKKYFNGKMKTKKKKKYTELSIVNLPCEVESSILYSSIFDRSAICSTGQETKSIDFSEDEFYHEWGSSATY